MITSTELTEAELFQKLAESRETNGPSHPETKQTSDQIFFRYRMLSIKKAKRYTRHSMPYRSLIDPCDIQSDADCGLLKAIDTYQLGRGASFQTHAFLRVHGSVIDGLRSLQNFPRIISRIRRELTPLLEQLSNRLGYCASLGDLSEFHPHLVICGRHINDIICDPLVSSSVFNQFSAITTSGEEDQDEMQECSIGLGLSRTRVSKSLDRAELSDTIESVLNALHEDAFERRVIYCYFFLGMTSTKIAKTMNISPTWVSDKKNSGLQKLRKMARMDQDFADELRTLSFR